MHRRPFVSSILPLGAVLGAALTLGACTGPGEDPKPPKFDPLGEEGGTPTEPEPIGGVGHGGFFDEKGAQIVPTVEFVAEAQRWYRQSLLSGLAPEKQRAFAEFAKRFPPRDELKGQARLVVEQRALEWLLTTSSWVEAHPRSPGKIRALGSRLRWTLPASDGASLTADLEVFELEPRIVTILDGLATEPGGVKVLSVTTNGGQAYLDECASAGVPIPPPINQMDPNGTAGWKSVGFIPQGDQFIVGTPAEVRSYASANGMCLALPRYSNNAKTTVALDGVICLSRTTSKVCFWDNQMNGNAFSFPAGTLVPIGVADLNVNPAGLYQAGGAEIEFGDGGACTDCHAGENPYIIHPESDLGSVLFGDLGSSPLNLPTFAPDRYDPIVGATWPQNQLSQALDVPDVCEGCHTQGGAGRFPHLSSDLPQYCNTVLAQALTRTMPPGSPGSEANSAEVAAFTAWCSQAPTSGPSNRGDPHLETTNGIKYDFQAAGEFTSLRESSSGFELQTRQSPVLTSFTPGANAYTGLASCVSLNTAAAVRLGKHRVTYQPPGGGAVDRAAMVLRVDGKETNLPTTGLDLGGGNRVDPLDGGGIAVRHADGTRVLVTPNFWSSEGYWYLNVEVLDTPAREGTMGHVGASNWLPYAPDGSSFGPAPAGIPDRHDMLNKTFADAWRVTDATSLFDYTSGTSTATYSDRDWPPPPGTECTKSAITTRPPVKGMDPGRAKELCTKVQDTAAREACAFDLTLTGDPGVVTAYARTLAARAAAVAAD